jgi:IclR family acetate operon transcriptional repressor
LDITTSAQPMMHRLWEETGETVALLVHQGRDRICVAELPSARPLSSSRKVGHRERITLGASGKLVLALSSDAEHYLAELVATQDQPHYREELAQIRDAGYAVSKDELFQGAVAMAAPSFMGGSKVLGSLADYSPSAHVNESKIAKIVALLLIESKAPSKILVCKCVRLLSQTIDRWRCVSHDFFSSAQLSSAQLSSAQPWLIGLCSMVWSVSNATW